MPWISIIIVLVMVVLAFVYMYFTKTGLFTSPFDGEWVSKQDGNKFAIYTNDPTKCVLTIVNGVKWPITLGKTSVDGKSIAYSQGDNVSGSQYIMSVVGDTIEQQTGELNGAKSIINVLYRQTTVKTE